MPFEITVSDQVPSLWNPDLMKLSNAAKFVFLFAMIGCLFDTSMVGAQDGLFLQNQIGDFGAAPQDGEVVTFKSDFKMKTGTRKGVLNVEATIASGWHVFSVTQAPGGPIRSTIVVNESDDYRVVGKFKPDLAPHAEKVEAFDGLIVEEHEFMVTWSATIELSEGVNPEDLVVEAVYNGQTCLKDGACIPLDNIQLKAKFKGYEDDLVVASPPPKVEIEDFSPDGTHVMLRARIFRAAGIDEPIRPGDKIKLEVTATPDKDWHIYPYGTMEEKTIYTPTIFAFTETNGWKVTGPAISELPHEDDSAGIDMVAFWHHEPITWTFDIQIPETAEDDKVYSFGGAIGFQTCFVQCDDPGAVSFTGKIGIGTASVVALEFENVEHYPVEKAVKAGAFAEAFPGGGYRQPNADVGASGDEQGNAKVFHQLTADSPELIAEMAKLYDPNEKIRYLNFDEMDANPIGSGGVSSADQTTFWKALFGAFVGGMLLNLMPCVFPVLGLKVMGFVKQAGSDPSKIRMHGLAFAMGLVASMWVLAGTILALKYFLGQEINWGAQMGNPYFVVSMIVLLFVLGLNMAGVFEIGTSLASVGGGLQGKKGYSTSFFSGVLTTLIATPCSGPFLGAAMGYTLSQPAMIAMFLFTIFALGIAAPYILLSCFPSLINKLPKPGAWMDTFKVTMAFALFATVAFFMQAFGGQTGVGGLSWLVMALVVIALAAFFYGRWSEPHTKPTKRWVFGHLMPAVIAGVGVWMCLDAANQRAEASSVHSTGGLVWQLWNPGKIKHSLATNKRIIWVDYTASW